MSKLYKDKDNNFYGYQKEGTEPTTKEYYDKVMKAKEDAYKATQEYINAEAKAYLASTDWTVTRLAETGKPIPDDVLQKRAASRETIL